MKLQQVVLTIVLSVIAAAATATYMNAHKVESTAQQESAYDRVLRTGVLRCGYAIWPPNVFVKDPQTGKVSGMFADIAEAIGEKLKIKIEWTEETGWGNFIESLKIGRFDAICASLFNLPRAGDFAGRHRCPCAA